MDLKVLVFEYIKERIKVLNEIGKYYSDEKINILTDNLIKTGKSFEEIKVLVDNKFSNQVRKLNHNNHLSNLKQYYISNIEDLNKNNNCYLLSYKDGVKILEQAHIKDIKSINESLKIVFLNNRKTAYQKPNSINNDYELIISDIAFLLNIPYNTTYRIFDKDMNAAGILNESDLKKNEIFITLEQTLKFIQEESPKFNLKAELTDFHDKQVKYGIRKIPDDELYSKQIEYVLKLFKALPDITEKNYQELKHNYLNMLVFQLLINSINNNLNNIGIIITNKNDKYTYRLSSAYNKYTIYLNTIQETMTICNFYIVEKQELLHKIISSYYNDVKELLSLIVDNQESLIKIIDQVLKEHLEYKEYNKYYNSLKNNITMINNELHLKKGVSPDTSEDKIKNKKNNEEYKIRVLPFTDNYVVEDVESQKGSVILTTLIAGILIATIVIIILVVIAISRLDM